MNCENANVSLKWPDVGLELSPYTLELRSDRDEFNWLKAKFSYEVGEYIKPHTKDDGVLTDPQPVEVHIDGAVRYLFYFEPDSVNYGTTNTFITLNDPMKYLGQSTVNQKWSNIHLKEVYREIFDSVEYGNVISGLKFGIPEKTTADIQIDIEGDEDESVELVEDEIQSPSNFGVGMNKLSETSTVQILDASYDIDLEDMSALDALWKLNKDFGLTSWTDEEGYVWVGEPDNSDAKHIASPDDGRTWRFTDVSITHPNKPIEKAVVKGKMIDAPNDKTSEGYAEGVVQYLLPDEGGGFLSGTDLMTQGVAQRVGITDGKTVVADVPQAQSDSLDALAVKSLLTELRNQNKGTVQIDGELSSKDVSDYASVEVGDYITLVPSSSDTCRSKIKQETYVINGVTHSFSGGEWSISLDVMMYPGTDFISRVRYFNPLTDDYLDDEFVKIEVDDE